MRIRTPIVLLPLVLLAQACQAGSVESAPSVDVAYTPLEATSVQEHIDEEIVDRLQAEHYSPVDLDDAFSRELLDSYLDDLDGTHTVLLASDVAYFREQYGDRLDDDLQSGNVDAAFEIFNTYQQRRIEIDQWLLDRLSEGVDSLNLSDDESVALDREDADWPADAEARRELWRKQLENQVINMRLNDVATEEIQKRLTRRYSNELEQLRQAEPMDVVSAYMGAFTRSYDPHTDYFSPRRSEDFEIGMNLELQGIGAQLRSRNGYPELVRLIPGGPAAKSGQLDPTDRITAVAQGKDGEFVDVVGMRLDEAVQLIRGKKGSVVRLRIVSKDGAQTKTVSLVRDKIELKDRAASKRVLEIEHEGQTERIALIRLPSFYKGTADDVRKLLEEIKSQDDVSGVVLDLRNNGGGALHEVTELVGLFMPSAPSVQIRDARGNTQVLGDSNGDPVYDGPLAVMVNRLSASASEIFAGAIQDYGRGLILGNRTFGKGTVQALMPLSKGRIKLTQAKFYRVTGASTQSRGVEPDITFPPVVDPEEIGESALPKALPWDKIEATRYPETDALQALLPELKERHDQRVAEEADFQYRVSRIELARRYGEREALSLNLDQRRSEQAERRETMLALTNKHRRATGKEPFEDYAAFEESEESDSPRDQAADQMADHDETDAYQTESAHILLDMLELLRARAEGGSI